jgi:PAS domain-containing protein
MPKSVPRTDDPLAVNQQRLDILERISDGFIAFDAQMNYTYVNEKVAQILREDRRKADL